MTGNVCIGQKISPANCTANDVLFEDFEVLEVVESCTEGVLGEAEVVFNAAIISNSPDRFGIGIFINLDGTSAITGSQCLHDFLSPAHSSTNQGDWPTEPFNGDFAYVEPYPNINGDLCGDIPGGSRVLKQLQQLRIACNDSDGDGFVDLSACASWENNQNRQCNSLEDAIPGNASKCGCTTVHTDLALPAQLTIQKVTTQGDGTFSFETTSNPTFDQGFSLPSSFDIATSGGTGSENFGGFVEPGNYTIDEVDQQDWSLVSVSCTNGDDPRASGGGVDLGPGDDVTCTFSNAPVQAGSITIIKSTIGGDGGFDFTGDLGSFTINTSGGSGNESFTEISPGNYTVFETDPGNAWDLNSISCISDDESSTSSSNSSVTITLADGGSVSCTFTNVARGSIYVTKVTDPAGATDDFEFNSNFAGQFSLSDGESEETLNLLPSAYGGSTYQVSESVPSDWNLNDSSCTGGNSADAIDLQPGETVTCTFTNSIKRGTIIVEKEASPGNTGLEFTFDSDFADGDGNFTLRGGETLTTSGLLPSPYGGPYAVSETVPDGWDLVSATCDGGHTISNIDLAPDETVTCTFENVQRGSITVKKIATGGDDIFEFSSEALGDGENPLDFTIDTEFDNPPEVHFGDLEPGTYDFTENLGESDWILMAAYCNVGDAQLLSTVRAANSRDTHNTVMVDLLPGQHATCTFENALPGTVSLTKQTLGGDDSFGFSLEQDGAPFDTATLTTSGGSDSVEFTGLEPGDYAFIETNLPENWQLTDAYCTRIDSEGNVTEIAGDLNDANVEFSLALGDTVNCTFENTKDGQIIVQKLIDPEGSEQLFEFVGPEGSDLNTTLGHGQEASDFFQPGLYAIAELVPEGWATPSVACATEIVSAMSAPAARSGHAEPFEINVDLAAGEAVTCVFTNRQLVPGIEITKTDGGIIVGQESSFAYLLEYANTGELDLTNVVVTEVVPENATFDSSGSTVGWSCADGSAAGTVCEFTVGDLPEGMNDSIEFGVTVDLLWSPDPDTGLCDDQPSNPSVDNTASIVGTSVNGDVDDNDSDTTPVLVSCEDLMATLTIEKVVSTGNASQVFEFSGSSNDDGFDSFPLSGGDSRTFGLSGGTYSVSEIVPSGWVLESTSCTGDNTVDNIDLSPEESVTCTFTNRELDPGISIDKSSGVNSVGQGGSLDYTLSYANNGETDLTNVVITEVIPQNTTFNAAGPNAESWSCAGNVCTHDVGSLLAGAAGSIQFPLNVDMLWEPNPSTGLCPARPQDPRVNNTAQISGSSDSGDVSDSDSESTPVVVLCQDQLDEHEDSPEPVSVPVNHPAALTLLILFMTALAGLAMHRRRRQSS